jgi:hypothetical protein
MLGLRRERGVQVREAMKQEHDDPAGGRAKREGFSHVAVRMDVKDVERLDALIPLVSQPWRTGTRSDVLRAVILRGLAELEKSGPKPPGKA